jgi:hypothetical protein
MRAFLAVFLSSTLSSSYWCAAFVLRRLNTRVVDNLPALRASSSFSVVYRHNSLGRMVAVLMLNESGYENVIAVVFCGKPQYRANVSRHAVFRYDDTLFRLVTEADVPLVLPHTARSATYAGVDRCAVLTDESYPPVGGVDAAATMKLFVGQVLEGSCVSTGFGLV